MESKMSKRLMMHNAQLKNDFHTSYGWANKKITIKRGTFAEPATNLPKGGYWLQLDSSYPDEVRSWAHHYGFHVTDDAVTTDEIGE
jgi:hypothetical protein